MPPVQAAACTAEPTSTHRSLSQDSDGLLSEQHLATDRTTVVCHCYRHTFPSLFSRLAEADASTSSILVDEFNASIFQRPADRELIRGC
jgi:hypothetical protein